MSKLTFKELFLFSSPEKKAKHIEFDPGKTMITSNSVDGTDRGKSVIMRSLYHAMGADCPFEDKWDTESKIYILLFSIDDADYYIYRNNKLFKVFDCEKRLLFTETHRRQLAEKLHSLFGFAVKLPRRSKADKEAIEKLEITPPAYNYLLYYVDQDGQKGSQFASFKGLSEYPDFKENVLYSHFGAFDDEYYSLIQQSERTAAEEKRLSKERDLMKLMLNRVYANIGDVSYSKDIEHLIEDVNRTKGEYNEIAQNLNGIRKKLIDLENDRIDLEYHLQALNLLDKENEKQITSLKEHVCPLCKRDIDDTLDLKIERYNTSEDIILLSDNMQYGIAEIDRKVAALEAEYTEWLKRLEDYEASMDLQSSEINDVIRHKGYLDIKEKATEDLQGIESKLAENESAEKEIKRGLHKFNESKKKINERYRELMIEDKNRFGLEGINAKTFDNINRTISAVGSNNPVATVIWYTNLLQIKHEFNPNAIDFPVVIDSPNNAETDDMKRNQIYRYICERVTSNQLIVSGIGFSEAANGTHFDRVITLDNAKYELLCDEDYLLYSELLYKLNGEQ